MEISAEGAEGCTKPPDRRELRARLGVGRRIVALQRSLTERVLQLEDALARVKQLQGLVPICSYGKKIRNDRNYWQQLESYISDHSEAKLSHGICPECFEKVVKPELESLLELGSSVMSAIFDSRRNVTQDG